MTTSRRLLPVLLLPLLLAVMAFKETSPQSVPAAVDGQPLSERAAQDQLPMAKSALWGRLAQCPSHFDTKTALYSITVSPQVKAMDGDTVTVNGFVLPLDGSDETRHFLLTKRTPVCMYCPPGEPNEVIEVKSKQAVEWNDSMVTMKGRFTLVNNGEKAIFFALDDAEKVK